MGFGEEDHRIKCHSQYTLSWHKISPWLTIDDVDFDHLAKLVFARFLYFTWSQGTVYYYCYTQ